MNTYCFHNICFSISIRIYYSIWIIKNNWYFEFDEEFIGFVSTKERS